MVQVLLSNVSCVFSGCDAGQTCARHGGVLGVIGSAKAIVTSSVFENVYAYTLGGAMVVGTGGAEIFITNSSFKNCKLLPILQEVPSWSNMMLRSI